MTLPADSDLKILARDDGRKVYQFGFARNLPANDDPKAAHHLGPYTDGVMNFPAHYRFARGTDRTNCPYTIIRRPAEIVASRLMFPLGDTGVPVGQVTARKATLMGTSSLTVYMPTTGERPDIGLITDWFAWYMLTGDLGPALEIANAAETFPIFFPDEATGRPVDLIKYPRGNCYVDSDGQGSPHITLFPLKPAPTPDNPAAMAPNPGAGCVPQQAHYPELSYGVFIATGDLGALETLQASANFTVMCDAARSTPTAAIFAGEMRGIGWASRNLFMAHRATQLAEADAAAKKVPLPSYLHPSSYYKTLLDNALNYYKGAMVDPVNQDFHLIGGYSAGGIWTPWQHDYDLLALAFGVLTGHDDWAPLYLFALKNAIDRGIGTRGYPLGLGGGMYFLLMPGGWQVAVKDFFKAAQTLGDPRYDIDKRFSDAMYASLLGPGGDPFNKFTTLFNGEYHINLRANLVIASYLDKIGLVATRAKYPELDTCIATVNKFIKYMVPRAAFVDVAPLPLPPTTTPPPVDGTPQTPPEPAPGNTTPPVTQPPATGGTMAKFLQGVSYLLTPKWDGAIYGAPVWALDKTDQLKLEVAQDGKSAKLTPNVDNTSEDFTVTVKAQNDPDKTDSFAVITLKGTDVLRGATTAGSTMDVAVAPAA